MACVFVQFRCTPGKTYEVADAIYDREVVSELFSTSGEYDLIAKVYIPEGE
ncbi:MAG: Lrp/AsnC ligand binding domain-containing protein, partial [Pseudorhodobacter sp.]|nr:Lrp/AsnC ligand binding domain-containing protein [Pseudorhodobacter sp.]